MSQDRFELLHQMRPQTSLDAVWTPVEQMAVRERILADRTTRADSQATSHTKPRAQPSRPRRRKWAALAGAVALAVVAAPGVAAAIDVINDGMRPQSILDAYGYWNDNLDGAVDPGTATRAATAPGPYGGIFSVLTSTNSEGQTCIGPVFETAASAAEPVPNDFNDGGSFCHSAPSTADFGFDTLMTTNTAVVWWARAGDAVTGELRTLDGERYPVVEVEGYLFGWYPLQSMKPEDRPTLTAYAADGSEVGSIRI
ncbi:hypothetical protein AB2L28_14965 [Kineococcus sp. TBRC 1896]|uniref:Uncharacterized protein n=1 Tax=Kineococcus mangrovi TaxID=1660183 RepID=A0ABV4I4C1_9ACTN